jgi:hypothetical protein
MKKIAPWALGLAIGLSAAAVAETDAVLPLENAHAHNDYEHDRPLLDALDHGFCSVEADIHLVDGALLVAHDLDKVEPERTLQALYLDPLRERAQTNGGRIYPDGPQFFLLIDIKSGAVETYEALREVLQQYADILTVFRPDSTKSGAVTVLVSGARPVALMTQEPVRLAAVDGRLHELDREFSRHLMPVVSDNWRRTFRWSGLGPMPDEVRQKLREIVARCHEQGKLIRFWATPERPRLWTELLDVGVDLINTDNLDGLQTFLCSRLARQSY